MKLALAAVVAAERGRVFEALVDPDLLRRSIPGCESMTPTGPDTPDAYDVTLKIGVAGLKGTYSGKVAVRDKRPPESLALSFEGQGAPGFVRGTARVALSDAAPGTRIACDADVQVGGLIAAIGSRLIEAAAKKLADDFFRQLSGALTQDEAARS